AFCESALATPGLVCVSSDCRSILRPRMPPPALISFTASLTPLSKFVPAVAPPPDNSTISKILIGPVCARAAKGMTRGTASPIADVGRRAHRSVDRRPQFHDVAGSRHCGHTRIHPAKAAADDLPAFAAHRHSPCGGSPLPLYAGATRLCQCQRRKGLYAQPAH